MSDSPNRSRWIGAVLVPALLVAAPAAAQRSLGTVFVGYGPRRIAIDPARNRLYVTRPGELVWMDGGTHALASAPVSGGTLALGLDVTRNRVYLDRYVFDGGTLTGSATTASGSDVVVDPFLDKAFYRQAGQLVRYDGATGAVADIAAGSPFAFSLDPATHRIFVADYSGFSFARIDAVTETLETTASVSPYFALDTTVNPRTGEVWTLRRLSGNPARLEVRNPTTFAVVDGWNLPDFPASVTVDPVTNRGWAAIPGSGFPYDSRAAVAPRGGTSTLLTTQLRPVAAATSPTTQQTLVVNRGAGSVSVIDPANAVVTFPAGGGASGVTVNPVTAKAYVLSDDDATVTVLDLSTNVPSSFSAGSQPVAVAIHPNLHRAYVVDRSGGAVVVRDFPSGTSTTIPVAADPFRIVVDPFRNLAWVLSASGTLTRIDCLTNGVTDTFPTAPGAVDLALDSVTDRVYVSEGTNGSWFVVDGASLAFRRVPTPFQTPLGLAVDEVRNRFVFADPGLGRLLVVDGASFEASEVLLSGPPNAVAVNPRTGRIYATTTSAGTIAVVDPVSLAVTEIPAAPGVGDALDTIVVDPTRNRAYVANRAAGTVTVLEGASVVATFALGGRADALAIDVPTRKLHVIDSAAGVDRVVDGITLSHVTVPVGASPRGVACDPFHREAVVANSLSGDATRIREVDAAGVPLSAAITPLPGNETASPTPTFDWIAGSGWGTPVHSLYFQIDGWQDAWQRATPTGGSAFTGTTAALQPGVHTVSWFVTDGQDSTNTKPTPAFSPVVGSINCYVFRIRACHPRSAAISAPPNVCSGSTGNVVSVPDIPGGTYSWTISGGTITGGAGTAALTFTAGTGTGVTVGVTVASVGEPGCTTSGGLVVPIAPNAAPPSPTAAAACGGIALTWPEDPTYFPFWLYRSDGTACQNPQLIAVVWGFDHFDSAAPAGQSSSYSLRGSASPCGVSGYGGCSSSAPLAVPAEVPDFRWAAGSGTRLDWSSAADATVHRVVRGDLAGLPGLLSGGADSCVRFEDPGTTTGAILTEEPSASDLFWYLVIGRTPTCTGPAGNASSGPRIVDASGSCP